MKRLVCLLAMVALTIPLLRAQTRTFSLADRATITLSSDWTERHDTDPPPYPVLSASAPRLVFSDFLVLENTRAPAIIKIGFSDNPFFGSSTGDLETRMHGRDGMLRYMFYFFFPPPRACLAQGRSRWADAQRRHAEEVKKETDRKRDKDEKPKEIPPPSPVAMECEYGPATADLFAQQLSPGFTFGERVTASVRDFYLPPLNQFERDGWTWFVFEAQSQRPIDRPELDKFGLQEAMRGSRVHYLWAFGARSPFPFLNDPLRKDLQIVHVAAALTSSNDDAAARFREILAALRLSN